MSNPVAVFYAASMLERRTLGLTFGLVTLAALGCGGSTAGEGSAPTEAGEAEETHATEGAEAVNPTDQCDPASIQLVGRYTLTSYPGQDTVGPNGERPMGMSKEYDFGANSYTMEGYPPLRITGRYEEVARDGLRIQVRFFDTVFDGRPSDDRVVWLTFDDCGTRFEMDGMTYSRRSAG